LTKKDADARRIVGLINNNIIDMMTLYRHPKLNSHGKEAYVLRATPSQTTPTYPKFPTMIYLLSNAPHGETLGVLMLN